MTLFICCLRNTVTYLMISVYDDDDDEKDKEDGGDYDGD